MTLRTDWKKPPRKKKKRKPLRRNPLKPVHRTKGEYLVFLELWAERPRYCVICGKPIKIFDIKNYSHILAKSLYPRYRLLKENILLKCFNFGQGCHEKWENRNEDMRNTEMWGWVFELYDKLRIQYNTEKQ